MKIKFILEEFCDIEDIIFFNFISPFCSKMDGYVQMKNRTIYPFLGKKSQEILDNYYCSFLTNLAIDQDPLCYALFMNSKRYLPEFQELKDDVANMYRRFRSVSKDNNRIVNPLRYFIKCYYREDDIASAYTIFDNTVFKNIFVPNKSIANLYNKDGVLSLIKIPESRNINRIIALIEDAINDGELQGSLDDINDIIALASYICWIREKNKPYFLTLSSILKYIDEYCCNNKEEVFKTCYLND